jgi:hypothetical protein
VPDTVDETADRLYGLPLEDFTRERDAAAKALRKEKRRDEAAVVAKLPKPSQASWAANHLAREQRKLVDELLAAGGALREAQEAAMSGGGAKALRDAGAAERAAVEALVDAARELEPGGRKPTETTLDRLRTTLHAAAGDDDVRAALDAGRLVEDAEGATAWGLLAALGGDEESATEPKRGAAKSGKAAASRGAAKSGAAKSGGAAKRTAADREAEKRAAAEEREARKAAEKEERERRAALEAELKEARAERKARDREAGRAERDAQRAARRLEDALAAAEDAREEAEDAKAEAAALKERAAAAADAVARLEEQLD